MKETEKKILLSCGLFSGISDRDREKLLDCLNVRVRFFGKEESVWHLGDKISSCAVVLSGEVRAETLSSDGRRSVMARHKAGALVGDVLMSTPLSKSPVEVVMAEEGKLAFLDFAAIIGGCRECCPAHIRLRENLINEIAVKFWALRRKIEYLSAASLRRRIAMRLADEYKKTGSTAFALGGTREELADTLGVNRSALSRELGRMKKEGIINFDRDAFVIAKPERLMMLAEEQDSPPKAR